MRITPDILLKAYATGIFPMSDGRDEPEIFWVDPETRGILPLDAFHLFCIIEDLPIASKLGLATSWSADCMALPWARHFLAKVCSAFVPMPPKWPWCIWPPA